MATHQVAMMTGLGLNWRSIASLAIEGTNRLLAGSNCSSHMPEKQLAVHEVPHGRWAIC